MGTMVAAIIVTFFVSFQSCKYNTFLLRPIGLASVAASFAALATWLSAFWIWTSALQFKLPVPWLSQVSAGNLCFAAVVAVWFSFPATWRADSKFRRRFLLSGAIIVVWL